MEPLRIADVKAGQTLDHFIYASNGRLLLTAGVPISPDDVSNLRAWARSVVYRLSPEEHQAVLMAKREGVSYDPSREHKSLNVNNLKEGDRVEPDTYKVGNVLVWVQEGRTVTGGVIEQMRKIGGGTPDTIFRWSGESLVSPEDFVTAAVSNYLRRRQRQAPVRIAGPKRTFETERAEARQKLAQIPADTSLGAHMKRTPTAWTPQRVQQINQALKGSVDQFEKTMSADTQTGAPRLSAGALRSHRQIVEDNVSLLMNDGNILLGLLNERAESTHLFAHGCKVSVLATEVAAAMNLTKQDVISVGTIALLHDVGMIRVPEAILTKTSPLIAEEFAEVRRHPLYSQELVSTQSGIPPIVQQVIVQVHERLDGSGYPQGLKADAIHPFARIISAVDAYTAMISPRPYRASLLPYHAVVSLLRSAYHRLFDREVVKTLISCLSLCPIGTVVQLNTGEVGQVIGAHKDAFTRPVVRILYDGEGSRVSVERVVDLMTSEDLEIVQTIQAEDLREVDGRLTLADRATWHEVYNIQKAS